MISNSPSPLLGPYPHPLLCGQAGMTPTNIRIKIINKIVPSDMVVLQLENVKLNAVPKRRSLGP